MAASKRSPNRLARETSPYLLQHAHNPVDWYPWGEEAFEKARREDRPIFLSVGYSSCHWCHVMERESFENGQIAEILNEHFVSVKVDREERPDVDALYMTSVQILTQSGGWPMSVFLTPDLKPFYGGTYFPPEGRYGRPGFRELLQHIATLYRSERDKVLQQAENLAAYLGSTLEPEGDGLPGDGVFEEAYRQASRSFDPDHGGFGAAPKFPHARDISLLLRHWRREGDGQALDMALLSLRRMAEGGIYDQIGGGFHRYSVDRQWLVPHFEKMLYDNALLAPAYFEAYQATGEPFHLRIGCEVLDYVIRDMTSPAGGFYSATDADSEGEEGKFFVWTPPQVATVVDAETARVLCLYYGISEGGNFENGRSIPHVTRSIEEVANSLGLDAVSVSERIEKGREALLAERNGRVAPSRDEKIIVAWNGLMITAMARGYQVTGNVAYRDVAAKTFRFIEQNCVLDGVLHRIHKDGQTRVPGFLDDYASLAAAAVDLYEATFEAHYLEAARKLADQLVVEFHDPGGVGLFYASARHTHLIQRRKEFLDNATPSGNWTAAWAMARLARLTGDERYRKQAEEQLVGLGGLVERAPLAFTTGLLALDFLRTPPLELVVIGDSSSPQTEEILRAIHRRFLPSKVVAGTDRRADEELGRSVPLLRDRDQIDGRTTVYICEDFACQTPIADTEALGRTLDGLTGAS